jgi:hypothetical protein
MHPIERLRYVARSSGADQRVLVRETAGALCGLRLDPSGIVTACRRIVERHPTSGPLWWLCSRLLTAPDPFELAWQLADEIEADPTPTRLVRELPDEVLACVVGWPDLVAEALVRRGDLSVLAVDTDGQGSGLARQLRRSDVDVCEVEAGGAGAAAASADVVLIEALACTSTEALCARGSRAVASTAYCSEVPVWLVAGRGRRLPEPTWGSVLERLADRGPAWDHDVEPVPLGLVSHVCGPDGVDEATPGSLAELLAPECPYAPELTKPSPF